MNIFNSDRKYLYTLSKSNNCQRLLFFFIYKIMEIWKDILDYEWVYQVSNLGNNEILYKNFDELERLKELHE